MKLKRSDRLYRGLGLCTMVWTLLSALGAALDPSLWICVAFGYAASLALAWMHRNPIDPTPPTATTDEGRPA